MMKKMPVVHSLASVLRTDGVLTGHGPSSNVSTTSLSRRKSSCLKCSKPKPGPPVVSISTTRLIPSASGLVQGALAVAGAGMAGAGAAAAGGGGGGVVAVGGGGGGGGGGAPGGGGVAALLAAGVCAQAVPDKHSETAPAK